ncbi:MAG: arginine--tRNA ligase [archaeon]
MKSEIIALLAGELKGKITKEEIERLVEVPSNDSMGDFAFPCFSLAKIEKKSPLAIAEDICERIRKKKLSSFSVTNVDAKGGYVNFFVDKKLIAEGVLKNLDSILSERKKTGKKIMVEFSQPNTHKAFHVGHIRGTSIGESLSRIFEFNGDKVVRANYSGDTGMHIAKWIWCYQRFHKKEELKDDESWIAGIYVDAIKRLAEDEAKNGKSGKLQEEVNEINRKIETKSDKEINELWKKTRQLSIKSWEKIYRELGTRFDVHFFEGEVELDAKKIAQDLVKKKIAVVDDGATIIDLKDYGLSVWVLLRSDGTVLYSAKDLVLAEKKMKDFPSDRYLVVVGDEQKLHFQQLSKTLELMKVKKAKDYGFLTFGMVRLPSGKMSSRTGDNILYSDFIDEVADAIKSEMKKRDNTLSVKELERRALVVAIAAIKYSFLKQDPNKVIIFEKSSALQFEGDTGPYLLYSYARASSIIRKVKAKSSAIKIIDLKQEEVRLLKKISDFDAIVEKSCNLLAPNLVANYCYELAGLFNEFYHACPVIGSVEQAFRLKLVDAFRLTIKKGLYLLGIDVLEEM